MLQLPKPVWLPTACALPVMLVGSLYLYFLSCLQGAIVVGI